MAAVKRDEVAALLASTVKAIVPVGTPWHDCVMDLVKDLTKECSIKVLYRVEQLVRDVTGSALGLPTTTLAVKMVEEINRRRQKWDEEDCDEFCCVIDGKEEHVFATHAEAVEFAQATMWDRKHKKVSTSYASIRHANGKVLNTFRWVEGSVTETTS